MFERWYKLSNLPDLTMNKYSSLEENGVDGVLNKHISFLYQLNRKGIVSGVSFHLFYLYLGSKDLENDMPGHRLHIFLLIRGADGSMDNIDALIRASALADYFSLLSDKDCVEANVSNFFKRHHINEPLFNYCVSLTKAEKVISYGNDNESYFLLHEWEPNESGRLYNMCNMMEALDSTCLYRVDLYPVERSGRLRDNLHKPITFLRKRLEEKGYGIGRDYEGRDVIKEYENIIEKYESEPHFIVNIFTFGNSYENATSVLDAAGSESLEKGKYEVSVFKANKETPYLINSFYTEFPGIIEDMSGKKVIKKAEHGVIICQKATAGINLNYMPTLFTLEEIAPFFRFPALYDGETIQLAKETAPAFVEKEDALYLGKDRNGYDVYFPLKLFPKHAFVSGVPGSGKTNTMHHITSALWKEKNIPFLVLEPAKQEYRALLNDPDMKDMYLFAPNADMSFPLHINPFEMPKGILIAEHIRRLCSVFEGAFPLEPPMPFLLDTAIEAVYRELGWIPEQVYNGLIDLETGQKRRLPTMSMLYNRLEEELSSTQYSDEVRGNLESALKVRIGSLLRREMGDVFDVPESTFIPERWLEIPAVIELESMGSGPANFLTLMLCSLIRETLKVNPIYDKGPVRHVIFIEEAHNLIGPDSEEQTGADADPKRAATAFIVKMLAEVRALKEGIVIADQLPTVMASEVLKNTGLKVGLRITSSDDRALLGSTMAASPLQLEQMSTFPVGKALIFYEGLMRPFDIRINKWRGELDDEVWEEMVTPKNDITLRNALCENIAFQDENKRSIEILGKKFYQLFEKKELIGKDINVRLSSILDLKKAINNYMEYFRKCELQATNLPEEEKLKHYDYYAQSLIPALEKQMNNYAENEEISCFIRDVSNWIYAMERLKTGRWKRFDAPQKQIILISVCQKKMYDILKDIWVKYADILLTMNGCMIDKGEMTRLMKLCESIDEEIYTYVSVNGIESVLN